MPGFGRREALLALGIVLGGVSFPVASRGSRGAEMPVFHVEGDTAAYHFDGRSGWFSIGELGEFDTTRVACAGPFVLMSSVDTLVVLPGFEPREILIRTPDRVIRETLFFTFADPMIDLLKRHPGFGPGGEDTLHVAAEVGAAPADAPPAEPLPEFQYAGPDGPRLAELRSTFALDSVAGDGDEIERILNVLEWAHTIVRHDGESQNPSPRTAVNLIRTCREEKRGVNCRMMATILNEAYLALGFRSRFVTCLPHDKNDPDCHVTNMVFSRTLDKWIYVDPTFGATFRDENGLLLGHAEIRERLIDGRTLRLPDSMDWNGEPKDHRDYLRYMAKNLFRFSCPQVSESGYETYAEHPVWVELDPVGYDPEKASTSQPTWSGVTYCTNDAEAFWAKPAL